MQIDFSNIEEKVFNNQELLPEFKDFFQQWKLGKMIPSLRPMAQKAVLDVLNRLDENHVRKLEAYFKTPVTVEKLDYTLVKTKTIGINDILEMEGEGELFLYRDKDLLYIGQWK